MAALWSWILAFLVWLSAGDVASRNEAPKAAAAVAAARASMDPGSGNVLP